MLYVPCEEVAGRSGKTWDIGFLFYEAVSWVVEADG